MTLLIKHPPTYENERLYAFHVILKEFLGLDYRSVAEERQDVLITMNDTEGRELLVSDVLFQTPTDKWIKDDSLPIQPLETFDLSQVPVDIACVNHIIPIIYGSRLDSGNYIDVQDSKVKLGLDIFGSAFFMLTRYEEVVKSVKDEHERFPARASLAYREGFLMRPIVNEYLEILWWFIKKLWPGLERKKRSYRVCLSHDVDWPLSVAGNNPLRVLKTAAGDVLKRKDVQLSMRRLMSLAKVCTGNIDADISNTFDFVMDASERNGLRSAFYFIADHTAGRIDGIYRLEDPWIRKLMKKICGRGHEIGLHASYNSFRSMDQVKREFERLISVAEEEGICQDVWGGRQHYLRWEAPTTWRAWEEAGLDYDSTLTFADHVGFRCGVCFEYPVYDILQRKPLALRERPLIVMEGSMLGGQYMRLSHEKSLPLIQKLAETCKMFSGDFTLLWHNSSLISWKDRELYGKVLVVV